MAFIRKAVLTLCIIDLSIAGTESFTSPRDLSTKYKTTQLYFGIPTFGGKPKTDSDDDCDNAAPKDEKKIGLSGLAQLITAGMGSPFLGDFEGVDEETGKMMFSLEANNLVDKDGESKQTKMPYFESGWVDEKDLEKERERKEKGDNPFKFW